MKGWVAKTRRPEVLGGIGGFAGLFDASRIAALAHPILATSTDGVGTKVAIAQAMDVHHTIGFDLVGMVVDDLVVCGAEPLFMTDYIACGQVRPERIAAIVQGIAEACVEAGCALVGGETAEHPGLLGPDEYDVAGAATGVVERGRLLGADRVQPGDVVVALASSGLHSNGYSLVRHVLLGQAGWALDRDVPELGRTLGEELLTPTRIYTAHCLALIDAVEVHAFSHVTGGGLANNLARVVPASCEVRIDRGTWQPAPIFGLVQRVGGISRSDLEAALNLGVGMVAVLPAESVDPALRCWRSGSGRLGLRVGGAVRRGGRRVGDPLRGVRGGVEVRVDPPPCPDCDHLCSIAVDALVACAHDIDHSEPRPRRRRPTARGSTHYGARPCKGKTDQGCPGTEVPVLRHRFHLAGT